jgi:hypothetical protein
MSNSDMGIGNIGIFTPSAQNYPIMTTAVFGVLVTNEIWVMTFNATETVIATEVYR